ncbi:MAG TPA: hypothetical protein OIM35_02545 [Clostridiaceae bacterium]|nr:hypothetical protein [Clostridiaceae bacterium]
MLMCFNNLSGCELVTLASILSIYISNDLSPDEIDTLGNFFSALGSNLSTIATAEANRIITSDT